MSNIKIFVTHSPNRNTMRVDNPLLYNVIAGSDYQTRPVPAGYYLDNQGDNISGRNKSYCELTTQYWAWKNQEADYYGFCHYRRFFSFSDEAIEESYWGAVEYDYLNEKAMQELHFNEKDMRERIEKYDFLIAKGVDVSCMNAKTIYKQYKNATELNIEDVDLLRKLIDEKYPELSETAKEFFAGHVLYPCNMFIMKKELFHEYSKFLFDILDEFERRADMSNYSREGYRTPGHLGERLTSIYYLYLQKQKKYRLGELQVALIHHTDAEPVIESKDDEKAVPVVLAANQKYVPILYTCTQSLLECATAENRYHLFIFHTDILPDSQKKFVEKLSKDNVEISFVNVGRRVAGYTLQAKEHITTETFYRFLILDVLQDYNKVVYLDCDMIICRDVADLYHVDMGDNLIAATTDADFAGQANVKNPKMKEYCNKVLKLENPFKYFQAGVLVFNVQEMRKVTSVEKLLEMADTGIYWYSDQDILNIICKDRVLYLDMAWNLLTDCDHYRWHKVIKSAPYYILDAYEKARKNPYIIHYAGWLKPWMKPDEDFAEVFWNVARKTDYYESLLAEMMNYQINCQGIENSAGVHNKKRWLEFLRKMVRHFFPKNSKARAWAIRVYIRLNDM